jgi:hypothetical protein
LARLSGLWIQQPKLIDVAGGNWLQPDVVGSYFMRGTGETNFPDRVLFTIAHHRDYRHRRKIRWLAGNDRCNEERKRQCSERRPRTTPEEGAVPKPLNHCNLIPVRGRAPRGRRPSFNPNP